MDGHAGALASTKARGSSPWMMRASAARQRLAWSAAARAPPSRGTGSWMVRTTGTCREIRASTMGSRPGTTSVWTWTTDGCARATARVKDRAVPPSSLSRSAVEPGLAQPVDVGTPASSPQHQVVVADAGGRGQGDLSALGFEGRAQAPGVAGDPAAIRGVDEQDPHGRLGRRPMARPVAGSPGRCPRMTVARSWVSGAVRRGRRRWAPTGYFNCRSIVARGET